MSSPFTLPPELSAKELPERRGLARDRVRLMVIERESSRVEHARFDALGEYLRAGDLLVFNTSRTLLASLEGCDAEGGPWVGCGWPSTCRTTRGWRCSAFGVAKF
jgi:S-adenosylmethionine:tRNA ribosyltransferase-isomerase